MAKKKKKPKFNARWMDAPAMTVFDPEGNVVAEIDEDDERTAVQEEELRSLPRDKTGQ